MKLLLDEMHAPTVADRLRDRGHDAVAVKERADLIGLPDEDLLRAATADGRSIVTENAKDFAALHQRLSAAGQRHSGLVITHPRRFPRSAGNHASVLADSLALFLDEHGAMLDEVESFIWWLERAGSEAERMGRSSRTKSAGR